MPMDYNKAWNSKIWRAFDLVWLTIVIVITRSCPTKLQFLLGRVDLDMQIQHPGGWPGAFAQSDGLHSKRVTTDDAVELSQLFIANSRPHLGLILAT